MSVKTDGTFTTASATGAARKTFPFDGDNASFIVEQDYVIAVGSYTPLALNTAHGTYTDAYLVRESPQEDIDGGLVKWTRTYAQVPANRDDYESYSFQFPGLLGTGLPPYNQYWIALDDGRDPFTQVAVCRVRSEYFLCATGETYETPSDIPILTGIKFTLESNTDARIDYLLADATGYWSDSDPSKEEWIALAAGGTGIGTGSNAGEFIPEDSTVERWMGNIYCRKTRYLKAI